MDDIAIIDRVEASLVRVQLDEPLVLGSYVVDRRDYVVVRVRTTDGVEGIAYALTRGAPTDLVVGELLGPVITGRDALDIDGRMDDLRATLVALGTTGIVGRALSLVEVCLWDIRGRVAGEPVWRLLGDGGPGHDAQVIIVAPYAGPDERDEAYAERLAPLAEAGYAVIKLYPLADAEAMARRLRAVRTVVGADVGLCIDMAWMWRTSDVSIAAVRQWQEADLAWVEDPHLAEDVATVKALTEAVDTPIAVGDEVSVPSHTQALIDERAVDILRMDSLTVGGLRAFASMRARANAAGIPVSPHAYGEIHRHVVHAWPDVGPVEVFPPGSPALGLSRFLAAELELPTGARTIAPPTAPGLGLEIDRDAAAALTVRTSAATRDD